MSVIRYAIPAGAHSAEIEIKHSRFIAQVFVVNNREDINHCLAECRRRWPKANHHCWAAIIGAPDGLDEGCSDDGEPSGTAGRPMLAVLQGSGLGSILVVVSRLFGGIKLGTGGLVRAYSDATRAALDSLPTVSQVRRIKGQLVCDYSDWPLLENRLAEWGITVEQTDFAEQVTVRFGVPADQVEHWQHQLTELGRGRWPLTIDNTE